MEENLHNDDFEKFLQDQVKHHRMFPSDKIWRNINSNLHKDYTWPALTIAAFVFIAAIIAVTVYFSPGPNIFAIHSPSGISTQENNGTNTSPLLTSVSPKRKSGIFSTQDQTSPTLTSDIATLPQADKAVINTIKNEKSSILSTYDETTGSKQITNNPKPQENVLPGESSEPLKLTALEEVSLIYNNGNELTVLEQSEPGKKILNKKADLTELLNNKELSSTGKKANRKNKFSYQVYISPSASYRKLREDRTTMKQQAANVGGPVGINYISDVNQIVRHKPGTGMEAGVVYGYNLTDKLKIKSGLQLNARQYLIEAFLSTTELATIAFSSGSGNDSMTSLSSYRTSSGYETAELTNRYYQFSIPIGVDYQVAGNKNIQLNIAAGIQPTYIITRNAFLISTDFKNYIENPQMTRKWNLNANLESYLSIKSGSYKWQLGPQLRYQMLPTSLKKYPIKEYLIDYGVKIGVSKSLQ
ncbi:MAG TPA: outer membrane beta-barrel protein [Segetibacter sp.]|jgi:hypothetical protein